MTSLDDINGPSIQTLLRGENDSKESDEIQANAEARTIKSQLSESMKTNMHIRPKPVW